MSARPATEDRTMQPIDLEVRPLTDADRHAGFLRATGGFSGAGQCWAQSAMHGMRDAALGSALADVLGIFGGRCGPGELCLTYQGAGLKIWISWEIQNHVTAKPTFEGKATIAMARLVYGIKDPADRQLALF